MDRAIYSAVSGLAAEQFTMDVIGNNIANVNTVGFKDSRSILESAFSQVDRAAGVNTPVGESVGLGAVVAGTQTLFTQGAFQNTGVNTDVGISGNGFLVVAGGVGSGPGATPPVPSAGGFYTRAGNLLQDSYGYLRTPNGQYVYGVEYSGASANAADDGFAGTAAVTNATDPYIPTGTVDYSVPTAITSNMASFTGGAANYDTNSGFFGPIRIPESIAVGDSNGNTSFEAVSGFSFATDGAITVTTTEGVSRTIGYLVIANFSNQTGLQDVGNSNFIQTPSSGEPTYYQPSLGPAGSTQGGTLELSNVDLATEFSNMIITQQGYDANAKTITTASEELQAVVNLIQ